MQRTGGRAHQVDECKWNGGQGRAEEERHGPTRKVPHRPSVVALDVPAESVGIGALRGPSAASAMQPAPLPGCRSSRWPIGGLLPGMAMAPAFFKPADDAVAGEGVKLTA